MPRRPLTPPDVRFRFRRFVKLNGMLDTPLASRLGPGRSSNERSGPDAVGGSSPAPTDPSVNWKGSTHHPHSVRIHVTSGPWSACASTGSRGTSGAVVSSIPPVSRGVSWRQLYGNSRASLAGIGSTCQYAQDIDRLLLRSVISRILSLTRCQVLGASRSRTSPPGAT